MHVIMSGIGEGGKKIERKWFVVVKKAEGPNVPTIPAIILARKICQESFTLQGVHPCVGLVTLSEYL